MASSASKSNFVEHAALSDVGLRRPSNQDSLVVALAGDAEDWARRGHLFMVADGMGAHAAGELASKLATDTVPHTYRKLLDQPAPEALRQAIRQTNARIHQHGQDNPEFHGMGTTTSALAILPQGAVVAHVGDSRVYRLRRRQLEQLTFDHSLVWEMMAAGQIPRGEGLSFIPKNIITRSLGPHPDVQIDLEGPFPLRQGDTFLLCSDGLSGQVNDLEIGLVLETLPAHKAARALVDLANLRGGPDNITVIVAKVTGAPTGAEAAPPLQHREPAASKPSTLKRTLWAAMVVFALAAVVLFFTGHGVPAAVSAIGAVAAILAGLLLGFDRAEVEEPQAVTAPLGGAPHTVTEIVPTRQVVDDLAQMAEQAREAVAEQNLSVDWPLVEQHQSQAAQALSGGDLIVAVRELLLAIAELMAPLRGPKGA